VERAKKNGKIQNLLVITPSRWKLAKKGMPGEKGGGGQGFNQGKRGRLITGRKGPQIEKVKKTGQTREIVTYDDLL